MRTAGLPVAGRHRAALRTLVGLTCIVVLGVVVVFTRRLFYHEVDMAGRTAERQIATVVGLPEEGLAESDARCRKVGRLLRAGPIYLRFSNSRGAVEALLERWQLKEQSGKIVVDRSSAPTWWPQLNEMQEDDFAFYENQRMKVWVRRADQVCFVFLSGG